MLPDGFESLEPDIRTSDVYGSGTCSPSDAVFDSSDSNPFAFQCLAAEGAVLVLHEGATAYEAVNMIDFERHASRHAISWYEYALNTGRNLSNGSLDFVTECIKSANWGIAVFYARPDADGYLRFIVNEGSYRWQRRGKVEARVGPSPTDISASDGERIRSQCVFLHGYKIMLRSDILEKLIKKNPWL
ncbi:hypothetical protein AX14_012202 [Amanita brunnescens Koide BX004]|nr:hypothetical protein AX14_012202 [Amanita brunnescens Koide BX004]